jgi:hypothetical protein
VFRLDLIAAGGVRSHRVGPEPIYVGRGPSNDIVVVDDSVSARHLAVWCSPSRIWIEDLRSRNGTWVNGLRVQGIRRVAVGDAIRIGEETRLELLPLADEEQRSAVAGALMVEDADVGLRYPVRSDRFRVGAAAGCDIAADGDPVAATLLFHPNGEVWLGVGDDQVEMAVGEVFAAGNRRLRVIRVPHTIAATREVDSTEYPYALAAALAGPTGPEATLTDLRHGAQHLITGETRAVLLYLLGKQLGEDLGAGLDPVARGWCHDDDVIRGIWGRAGAGNVANNLNVLVCRVRREVQGAGFDPWFLEKRRGFVRVRVREVTVST